MKLSERVFVTLNENKVYIAQDANDKDLKVGDIVYFTDKGKEIIMGYKGADENTRKAKTFVNDPMKVDGIEDYHGKNILVLTLGLEEEGDIVKASPNFVIKK